MQHINDAQASHLSAAVVIEDDPDIRDLIITVFERAGFVVHSAMDGENGVMAARVHSPSIVTVDLGLPGIDGFEVARRIRAVSDCYLIMISARTDEAETLMGLGAGADDFITKPFRPRELRARIDAMMRRPRALSPASPTAAASPASAATPAPQTKSSADTEPPTVPDQASVYQHNGVTLDPATRSARVHDQLLNLTRTEFDLLEALMSSGRRVRTKANLVRHLRADHVGAQTFVSEADERAVEVHIGNLRRKLGQSGQEPMWIETVRGVGYRMAVQR
ncbi:response regulator transcription factor [Nesterenkonia haasae]|uniref:response regulator transcription factor n=1 Tax=Nesterenkonia haasae TaxID=2587813 RepID=UPI002E2D8F1C|nr:response regulator transcription factor [Nesterenkonia haasae]